tara:strand:- start:533 stop:1279 length:747 start_codon:yes stop_codon:yes gene_type:complete
MSTLKSDAITAATGTNTDLDLSGKGSGVPDIATGFKVGGTAGVPVNNLRTGTDGELITWDASGDPATVAVGTATHVLTSNGVGAAPTFQAAGGGLTLGTEIDTSSGSNPTFTGIPAGTKLIYLMLFQVSTAGTDQMEVRIGDAGGIETSGYESVGSYIANSASPLLLGSSAGFAITDTQSAGDNYYGTIMLTLEEDSDFTWTCQSLMIDTSNHIMYGAGGKQLSAELTQIQLQSNDAFDNGKINISYS